MASTQPLILRADASPSAGAGHVMRCLALAQAWRGVGGSAIFVTPLGASPLQERLKSEGFETVRSTAPPGSVVDAMRTADIAREVDARWVVVDDYHGDAGYQKILKDAGLRLMWIDDSSYSAHYYADVVLNQNLHACEAMYASRETYTRLLLGTRHVLLRREFLMRKPPAKANVEQSRLILVTLGGFAPGSLACRIVTALQQVKSRQVQVALVGGYTQANHSALRGLRGKSRLPTQLVATAANMAEWMRRATLAISAAGSTSWELAYSGTPGILIAVAENQIPIAGELHATGAFISVGPASSVDFHKIGSLTEELLSDPERVAEMSQRAKKIVDGDGVSRVVGHLRADGVYLRVARENDCSLFWEWANDPVTRGSSLSTEQILLEDHVKWFDEKLHDPRHFMFVACRLDDRPVGQSRLHLRHSGEAEISIAMDPAERGKGLGAIVIDLSVRRIFHQTRVHTVHAYIKPSNRPSIKVFEKAMFEYMRTEKVKGWEVFHFVRTKNRG